MNQTIRRITLLDDESWWGGASFDGVHMPFDAASDYRKDLRHINPNQAMPLLLSSKGRYVWSEGPFTFSFNSGVLTLMSRDGDFEVREEIGSLREAFTQAASRHFTLNGRIPDPLAFTAPQYNTWIEMHYEPTQQKVLAYAEGILSNGMPPGVLIIDDNWMRDYGNLDFNRLFFPDPKEMMRRLHTMGFKVMLWVCPYVSSDGNVFMTLREKGFLLKDLKGEPAIREWWNGFSSLLDLSNPDAVSWFTQELDGLVEMYGVDGFKFDAGNPVMTDDEDEDRFIWHRRIEGNEDTLLYASIGTGYALSEYRECWKGAGLPLIQRQQDKAHVWGKSGLSDLIPNGLAQSIMGYAYNCPDLIGGGSDAICVDDGRPDIDQELFIRYTQCSALFPMMQFSVAPWRVLDEKHLGYCMEMVELRKKMGPEILALARHAAETGEPMIRPMEYVFPGKGYQGVVDQFMLGDDILVAPILEKGARTRRIHFPEGDWVDESGILYHGGICTEVVARVSWLPWFRRVVAQPVDSGIPVGSGML